MSENGLSEEEFAVFQKNMNDVSQQAFQLKEELSELTEQTKSLQSKRDELATLEQRREEMKERHKESLKVFHEELENKQKEAIEQQEKSSQKVVNLNKTIAELNQKIKDKEENCEQVKNHIKTFDSKYNSIQQEIMETKKIIKELKPNRQYVASLLPIPMYIEDLSMQNFLLRKIYDKNQAEISEYRASIASYEKKDKAIRQQIKDKRSEADIIKGRLNTSKEQYQKAEVEIERTKKALEEAVKRLNSAKSVTENAKVQRVQMEEKYNEDKKKLLEELDELRKKSEENQKEIEAIKGECSKELASYEEKVKEIRKKISIIRETGIDPDSPSVDSDLQTQMLKVNQDKKVIQEDMDKTDLNIRALKEKIKLKEEELNYLALKMKPTPKILQSAEFKEKMLLLEELVIQNKNLKDTFENIATKVETLKQENKEIRSNFRQKMEKK